MDKQWRDNTTTAVLYPTEVKTSLLNVDSRFRDLTQSSSSCDFLIRLPRTYKNVITLRMSSIELPNTWYAFSKEHGNTSLLFDGVHVCISEGNYDPDTISAALENAILAETTATNIAVTFDRDVTSKITIDNAGTPFRLDFGTPSTCGSCESSGSNLRTGFIPYNSGLGYWLGFTSTAYSNRSTYTGEFTANTMGDNYVFLQLPDLEDSMESFSYGSTSIKAFAKIIVQVDKNALIYDNGANTVSKETKFAQPTNISTFRVRLVDAYGSTLNLMADFSFTLELQEVVSSKVYEAYRNNLISDS